MESATEARLAKLRRVYELFNSLPRDPIARRESPATKELLARDHYRGREGVELDEKGAAIYTFSGPKIVRFEAFLDHETARREFER
jgi:hypothetical protein